MDIYEADYVSNKTFKKSGEKARGFDMTTTIANFIGAFSLENILRGSAYPVAEGYKTTTPRL
jgi:hypothetical protein